MSMTPTEEHVPVLIAGAGPVGLILALELEHHGVKALLVERNTMTTRHPKMDITNGRSMELLRRFGIVDYLRKVAIPSDHPMVVSWVTRLDRWELTRFTYPCVDDAYAQIRSRNDGRLPLEPSMRVSQILLEPALKELHETRANHITVEYGWQVEDFTQNGSGVDVTLRCAESGQLRRVHADYLVGCDGAGSTVRRGLGIAVDVTGLRRLVVKELGARRVAGMLARAWAADRERPADGRFYMIHFTTTDRELFHRFGTVWHVQSPTGWTLISQNDDDAWTFHWPLGVGENPDRIDPKELLFRHLGRPFECDILVANAWTPRLAVARRFGIGRVWLAGDAVHQVPPTGGYGMNTGVGDAVGLGWALAAIVHGWGGPNLLSAYEIERRSVALRNKAAAGRHSVVRLAIKAAFRSVIHSEGWNGERSRRRLGRVIADLGNLENEALGIEIGYRYDDSPVVASEAGTAPVQTNDAYTPTTWPGSRPPSVFLADGGALFDLFGKGFTLLRFTDVDTEPLAEAADQRGVPLDVVDIRDGHARRLYERDLVLIRPHQHVAWRGNQLPPDPLQLIDKVRGA
jgi:2-polyprenyl-6-methoxyphenol hydroxylase-like FAD-dependent oxidoreductase